MGISEPKNTAQHACHRLQMLQITLACDFIRSWSTFSSTSWNNVRCTHAQHCRSGYLPSSRDLHVSIIADLIISCCLWGYSARHYAPKSSNIFSQPVGSTFRLK